MKIFSNGLIAKPHPNRPDWCLLPGGGETLKATARKWGMLIEGEIPRAATSVPKLTAPPAFSKTVASPSTAIHADRMRALPNISIATPHGPLSDADGAIRTGMSVEALLYVLAARAILDAGRIARGR